MKQRLLSALVAILSLFALHPRLTLAQETPPATSEPSTAIEATETEPLILEADEKVRSIVVQNRYLIIKGEVAHDVVAINSEVTIAEGAKVGGQVLVFNGSVKNEAKNVHWTVHNGDALNLTGDNLASLPAREEATASATVESTPVSGIAAVPARVARTSEHKNSWSGNQFALFLIGLVGALVLLLVAPRATTQATDTLAFEPGRCLAVGALGAFGLLTVSLLNVMIMKGIGIFWSPVGTLVGIVSLVALGFGWLCGMRFAGDLVARKFGRCEEGSLFGRVALGLGVFCLAKLVLHSISGWFGGGTLLVEAIFAMMGFGALLISGFGSNPDWLGARLRGERRWVSRR